MIANLEDNWRVGRPVFSCPTTCWQDSMPLPGARLLESARKATASRNYRGCNRLAFFVELSVVAREALSACAQHSLDELGARS